jgi:hypothetical protein
MMHTEMLAEKESSVRQPLLLMLFSFAEALKEAYVEQRSQQTPPIKDFASYIRYVIKEQKELDFKSVWKDHATDLKQIPTSYEALWAFTAYESPLYAPSSLVSKTARTITQSLISFEVRLQRYLNSNMEAMMISLYLDSGFITFPAMLQMVVRNQIAEHIPACVEVGLTAGKQPALDYTGSSFLDADKRINARAFPTSIVARYSTRTETSPLIKPSVKVHSVYTSGGGTHRRHKVHTWTP